MSRPTTISPEYLALQTAMHQNPDDGAQPVNYAPGVRDLLSTGSYRSLLDYGAGKQRLLAELKQLGVGPFDYRPYDPAVREIAADPEPADLVCCINVAEHVEPDRLDVFLDHVHALTLKLCFMTIAMQPAAKTLPDGRNAHLTVQPVSWWLPKLCRHFEIAHLGRNSEGFWLLAEPRPRQV